jgi:hypothetical protein
MNKNAKYEFRHSTFFFFDQINYYNKQPQLESESYFIQTEIFYYDYDFDYDYDYIASKNENEILIY